MGQVRVLVRLFTTVESSITSNLELDYLENQALS